MAPKRSKSFCVPSPSLLLREFLGNLLSLQGIESPETLVSPDIPYIYTSIDVKKTVKNITAALKRVHRLKEQHTQPSILLVNDGKKSPRNMDTRARNQDFCEGGMF